MNKKLLHWLKVCLTIYGLSWLESGILPYLDIGFKGPTEPMFATNNLLEKIALNLEIGLFITLVTGTIFLLAYIFVLRQRLVSLIRLGVIALATQLIAEGIFLLSNGKAFGPLGYFGVLLVMFFLAIVLLHFGFREHKAHGSPQA